MKINNNNIILIGFMGTGKTSAGKVLASKMDLKWIDIDEEIEKSQNMSVSDIFEKKGGDFFRECETCELKKLENIRDCVISTGGGIVKSEFNREFLKKLGFIVHLRASFNVILDRVEGSHTRPLLDNIDRFACVKSLWEERKELYDIAHIAVNTDKMNIADIADLIRLYYENSFYYDSTRNRSHVIVRKNLAGSFDRILKGFYSESRKIAVVTDSKVFSLYRNIINSISDHIIVFPEGENLKKFENCEKIITYLHENSFSRHDIVIGFGGGTVTDLSGFAASIYKRGCHLVFIPTTLLSMIDASVGGKNGVNSNNIKNGIGTFYQPDIIIIDSFFLHTLEKEDILSGMGEMIKYAFLSNYEEFIENTEKLDEITVKVCEYKANLVERDELDNKGIRSLLNLGHTFAHVIETLSGFSVKHGIAVCDGMYYAWKTSLLTGKISVEDLEHFRTVRKKSGFDQEVFDLKRYSFYDAMEILRQDKKIRDSRICLILPEKKDDIYIFSEFYFTEKEMESLWRRL